MRDKTTGMTLEHRLKKYIIPTAGRLLRQTEYLMREGVVFDQGSLEGQNHFKQLRLLRDMLDSFLAHQEQKTVDKKMIAEVTGGAQANTEQLRQLMHDKWFLYRWNSRSNAVYGPYDSREEATNEINLMPPAQRKAWSSIQALRKEDRLVGRRP